MFKMRSVSIFALNLIIMAGSLVCHQTPRGDEYLVLFAVPLICVISPFALGVRQLAFLVLGNLLFLGFYRSKGILDLTDFVFFGVLVIAAVGVSHVLLKLEKEFREYYGKIVSSDENSYNQIVKELEGKERKGRIVESELARISRLYEITKQLGAVLRFDDFVDVIFNFLENNFRFDVGHLLLFSEGRFAQGISRVSTKITRGEGNINYDLVVARMKDADFESFFYERYDNREFFKEVGIKGSDTFMAFPLKVEGVSAILAIEGATKLGYDRFSIVIPQIALELRKVELYEQVERLSLVDGLTGTFLRRYLMDRLEEEIERAKRLDLIFSVAMVDIDHFKECNDTYGHLAGDAVLREVAARLKTSVREVDMVSRYGGEEFCILLPETNKDLALSVAERLRKTVEYEEIRAYDVVVKSSVSVGIASFPEDGEDIEALIEKADTALYRAKGTGRNKVVCA